MEHKEKEKQEMGNMISQFGGPVDQPGCRVEQIKCEKSLSLICRHSVGSVVRGVQPQCVAGNKMHFFHFRGLSQLINYKSGMLVGKRLGFHFREFWSEPPGNGVHVSALGLVDNSSHQKANVKDVASGRSRAENS